MKTTLKLITLILLTYSTAFSQTTGTLTGYVYDMNEKFGLISANIILEGTDYGTASDADGKFELENIPVGTYNLKISYIGYVTQVVQDVVIRSSRPTILTIELEPTPLEIEGVTVKTDYFAEQMNIEPSTITLSKEEIRRFPGGFEDVVRTVSTLPGVTINNSGGRNDILVRGGGPSENLYVLNNIEVPNINHFGTQGSSTGSLSFINLDFIEKVNFSSGGFNSTYGDKMSSILTLDLAQGRSDRIGGKALVSATQFGFNFEGPISNSGNYIFSARRSYLDFIFKAAGLPFIPVYTDYNLLVNYNLSQNDRLFILGLAAIDNVERTLETEEDKVVNSGILGNAQNQYITGLNYRRIHNNGFADVTLNWYNYNYNFEQGDTAQVKYFESDAKESEFGLKGQRFWKINSKTNLTAGFSGKLVHSTNSTTFADTIFDSNGNRIPVDSLGIPQLSSVDRWDRKYALFVNSNLTFGDFTFGLGARADIYEFIENPLYLSPRLSLKYNLNPENYLKFSWGFYYQSPSYVWLTNPNNKDLKALKNQMFIGSWNLILRPDLLLSLEAYYKSYTDLPTGTIPGVTDYFVQTNTGAAYGGREENFASFGYFDLVSNATGRAYGIELLLQKKFSEIPFYGKMSITLGKSEVTAGNGKTYDSPFDQRFIFNLSSGYKLSESWEISGKFRLFTGIPYTPVYKPDENPVAPGVIRNLPDEYLSARLNTAHHLDIRVDKYFNFEDWTLIVFLDIQNIYNYKVPIVPTYNFYEDTIQTSNSIGVLPSIGISAEF